LRAKPHRRISLHKTDWQAAPREGALASVRFASAPGRNGKADPARVKRASRPRSSRELVGPDNLILQVEAENQVLIAKVEFAVGDHGMGPESPCRRTNLTFFGQGKAAVFFPAAGTGLHQHHNALALAITNQVAVGIGQ